MSVAVGMDETTYQCLGMVGHDQLLPGSQSNLAFVLATWSVLGEEARPVLPIGIDLDATDLLHEADLLRAASDHDATSDLVDDVGILHVAHDSQSIYLARRAGQASVTQVGAQQIGIRLVVDETLAAARASV
jgi:hypothetical protein